MFAIAVKLAGTPELWRELGRDGTLRFHTEEGATVYLDKHYTKLQGVHHRCDLFHGLQPMKIVPVSE